MNTRFFNLSDGCHGSNQEKSIFVVTTATHQKNKKAMYSFYALHYTEQSRKISEQTNKWLLRKNVAKSKLFGPKILKT